MPYSLNSISTVPSVPKSAREMSPGCTESKPVHLPVETISPAFRPRRRTQVIGQPQHHVQRVTAGAATRSGALLDAVDRHRDRMRRKSCPEKSVEAPVASRRASMPITTTVVTMMRPKLRVAAPGGRSMCTSRSRFIASNRSFSFLSGLATGSFGGARRAQER